jgi:hypothetical protein
MAFCEECPMRGRCVDEIKDLKMRKLAGEYFGAGTFMAVFGAFRDKRGGLSKSFNMPTDISARGLANEINSCEYPDYESKGIFRKRQVATCRVLGEYACIDPGLEPFVEQAMALPVPTRKKPTI